MISFIPMPSPIDTVYDVETPEAIDLTANLAGPLSRVLAYSLDLCVRSGVLTVATIILAFMNEAGWGVFLILSFLMEWFYPVLFEVLRQGQTPGKKWMGLAVVNDDLTPVTWSSSIIRNLLRAVDILPFAYCLGLVSMTCSKHFQRLGDFAAGTVVVYRKKNKIDEQLPDGEAMAPPVGLSIDDHLAIANFTRRHDQISLARQAELANLLEPVTQLRDEKAVKRLYGIGLWLLGAKG